MRTTCGQGADDTRVRFRVRFHQRMTYVIQTSSTCHPDTCLSCPISWSTTPGVIHMSSAHHPQTHMLSACHLHVICTHMSSTCHPHTSLSCPISCSTMPGVICTSSADTHIIRMSSAHHLQIHTSLAQSS